MTAGAPEALGSDASPPEVPAIAPFWHADMIIGRGARPGQRMSLAPGGVNLRNFMFRGHNT
jgi:hypothetical protein